MDRWTDGWSDVSTGVRDVRAGYEVVLQLQDETNSCLDAAALTNGC